MTPQQSIWCNNFDCGAGGGLSHQPAQFTFVAIASAKQLSKCSLEEVNIATFLLILDLPEKTVGIDYGSHGH
jgi:hypothetical protein